MEKYFLLLLAAPGSKPRGHEPVSGGVWLQKEMFFISKNVPELEELTGFEDYKFGKYSEVLEDVLEQFITDAYVNLAGNKIELTKKGNGLAEHVWSSASKEERDLVQDIKSTLNDMTSEEVLGFAYAAYPEMKRYSEFASKFEDNRVRIAVSLLKKGKVSKEKAAEIAGMPLEKFLSEASKT